MVSSDDNVKTGECVHTYKKQDRKMNVLAIGDEIEEGSDAQEKKYYEDGCPQTPTMGGHDEEDAEDEGPNLMEEIEKNIDH